MAYMLISRDRLKKISTIASVSSLLILSSWQSSIAQSSLVYVILYNAKSNNEGIYSIQNEKTETILVFNSESAAKRYASQLKMPKVPQPNVEAIGTTEILNFCRI
jgi:Protein of unknown function (DUF3110)